ncbi:MAG: hypothetical protein ACYS4T_04760 [Planctomycetota bacterium]
MCKSLAESGSYEQYWAPCHWYGCFLAQDANREERHENNVQIYGAEAG